MTELWNSERRRALRLNPADVEVRLILDKNNSKNVQLADISTLGLGIVIDFEPPPGILNFKLKSPQLLANLEIQAQPRHVHPARNPAGHMEYRLGCEFLFSSAQQQNSLLRWFAGEMRRKIENGPESAKTRSEKAQGSEVRFPQTENEFEKCLHLVKPLTVEHAMIQTKFFTLFEMGEILALVPLFQDVLPFGMTAEKNFPHEIRKLKSAGGRFGEIGPFCLNPALFPSAGADLPPWHRLRIFLVIFQRVLAYAVNFARLTHLVAVIPPSLEEFYRLWLFSEVKNSSKNQSKGKLFCVDLRNFENRIGSERPEIAALLAAAEKNDEAVLSLDYSYYPTAPVMKKWFLEEARIFTALKHDEVQYFRFCFPGIFD